MSDYNWCHGPECHTTETQSRVRGTGDNKVLRTRKVKIYNGRSPFGNGGGTIWDYFCNHNCFMDYVSTHGQAIINIAPVQKPKETPIKVEKEKYESYRYKWNAQGTDTERVPYQATRTIIKGTNE